MMASMGCVVLMLLFLIIILHTTTISCSMGVEEDLELDRQLKILNKKPVKTFQEEKGDIVDCIDIYKQPAFDHPLLNNHKIQLRPSHFPKGLNETSSSSSSSSTTQSAEKVEFKQFDCPKGTVPIRRTSKKDLIRAKLFSEIFNRETIQSAGLSNNDPLRNEHIAILQSINSSTTRSYYGAMGRFKVDKPLVVDNQFSSSQIWLEGGLSSDVDSIQVGYAVAPSLFGDDNPRTFTYWRSTLGNATACFNLLCPGFVQTGSHAIGLDMKPISIYGAKNIMYIKILIYQDIYTGNWWLNIMDNVIGYWPRELVPWLGTRGADYIAWGGFTRTDPNSPNSPQMGNGYFPPADKVMTKTSAMFDLRYMNASEWLLLVKDEKDQFVTTVDSPNCFNFINLGDLGDFYRFSYLFGGPGGANC